MAHVIFLALEWVLKKNWSRFQQTFVFSGGDQKYGAGVFPYWDMVKSWKAGALGWPCNYTIYIISDTVSLYYTILILHLV